MQPTYKTYKTDDGVYDIPEVSEKDFLKDYPNATQVNSFKVGKDTFDIPVAQTQDFLKDNPQAKSLSENESLQQVIQKPASYSAPTNSEYSNQNPIDLAKQSDQLSKATIPVNNPTGGIGSISVPTTQVPDQNSITKANEINDYLKKQGYDPDQLKTTFSDFPDQYYQLLGKSKDQMAQEFKNNPSLATREVASAKWQVPLLQNITQKGGDSQAVQNMRNAFASDQTDYATKRKLAPQLLQTIRQYAPDDKSMNSMLQNFSIDAAQAYGDVKDDDPTLQQEKLQYPNLDINQIRALDYLQDTKPFEAQGYKAALIDPKLLSGDYDAQTGQEEKLKRLEEIGIGLKSNTLNEKYDATGKTDDNLKNKILQLEDEKNSLPMKYPKAAINDAGLLAQEILGQKNTGLDWMAKETGNATNSAANSVWDLVSQPFRSQNNDYMHQMAVLGETSNLEGEHYVTQNNQTTKTFTPTISNSLLPDVNAIKNDTSLSYDEKYNKLVKLLMNNPDKFTREPINGGKSNLGVSSLLYGTGQLAANLAPYVLAESATGGGASASFGRKFISSFTSMMGTSFRDAYAQAIKEGQSDPYGYAFRTTAINSAAMAGAQTPEQIRDMLGGTKTAAGDVVSKMTDDEIMSALRNEPKEMSAFKKANNFLKNSVGKSALESVKSAAKITPFITAGNIANNAIDGNLSSPEDYTKQALIEGLKFSILGTGLGVAGKLGEGVNDVNKASIYQAATDPEPVLEALKQKEDNGSIGPEDANQVRNNITKAQEVFKKVPFVDAKGDPLSEQNKRDLLFLKIQENDIGETLKKDIPKDLANKLADRLVEIQAKEDNIYKGVLSDANQENKPVNKEPEIKSKTETLNSDFNTNKSLPELETIPYDKRTDAEHATFIKQKFLKEFTDKGIPNEQVNAAVALLDARAKIANPANPDAYYRKIQDISNGQFLSPDVKYQGGKLKAAIIGAAAMMHPVDISKGEEAHFEKNKIELNQPENTAKPIKILDDRKNVSDRDRLTSTTNVGDVQEIIDESKKRNIDPYTALAMVMQETGFKEPDNPFHIRFDQHKEDTSKTEVEQAMDLLREKLDYADKLGKKTEAEKLQAWNGYGKIGRNTEGGMKSIYGKEIPAEGFDMNKDPMYGNRIIDLRDNVIKKNPEIVKLVDDANRTTNIKFQDNRGALETLANGRKIIHALDAPDFSTAIHEIAHIFEDELSPSERKVITDFSKQEEWNSTTSEVFARGFERYLRDGKAPVEELKSIFLKAKEWLQTIYQKLSSSPIAKKITPDVKEVFDNLFKEEPKEEISSGGNGKEIEPHKEVSASKQIAIKEVAEKYGLKPMEATMLHGLSGKNIEDEFDSKSGLKSATLEKLYEKGFITYADEGNNRKLSEKGNDFIKAVDARHETRKNVKAGSDLFPAEANIPEIKLNKSEERVARDQIKKVDAERILNNEITVKDIEAHKHLFDGYPFQKEDYQKVKTYLNENDQPVTESKGDRQPNTGNDENKGFGDKSESISRSEVNDATTENNTSTETAEPTAEDSRGKVGISHEALNELAEKIGLPPIERGKTYDIKELADRGRKLLIAGVDPNKIMNEFYNSGDTDENGISVIRAKIEELTKKVNSVEDKKSQSFKDDFDDLAKWIQVEKDMGTYAHRLFKAFQGQRDLDTDAFTYVSMKAERKLGRGLTGPEKDRIDQMTKDISRLKGKVSDYEERLKNAIDNDFTVPKPETDKKSIADDAKNLAAKIRTAKIHRPDIFSAATPASLVWDAAVETVATTIEGGGKLAEAIRKGIDYIRDSDWYKGLSSDKKKEAEDTFVNAHRNAEGYTLDNLREMFADKKGFKFTREEAKAIWEYGKNEYLNKGYSYKDMLAAVSNDLGFSMKQISNAVVTPKTKPLSDEMWKKRSELAKNSANLKRWVDNQGGTIAYKTFKKAINTFREVAVFGHGAIFVGTHAMPTLFDIPRAKFTVKALFNAYKAAYGNRTDYELMVADLKNSENYIKAQRAGLQNNPERIGSDSEIISHHLKWISEAGERGFNAIKILRQQLFDVHYQKLPDNLKNDPQVLKEIAQIVNNATGATNYKVPDWMRETMFAGGMEISRWERIVKNPTKAAGILGKIVTGKATPAEKVFLRIWATRAGTIAGVYTGALIVNNAINAYLYPNDDKKRVNFLNPSKGDWFKFKFGTVVLDPTSGMNTSVRFATTLAMMPFEDEKYVRANNQGDNRKNAIARRTVQYGLGKLSPGYTTIAEYVLKHDYNGNTVPFSDDKPYYKHNRKLNWIEYGSQKLPLPIAEGTEIYNEAANETGVNRRTWDLYLKGIGYGALSGLTGIRAYENSQAVNKAPDTEHH